MSDPYTYVLTDEALIAKYWGLEAARYRLEDMSEPRLVSGRLWVQHGLAQGKSCKGGLRIDMKPGYSVNLSPENPAGFSDNVLPRIIEARKRAGRPDFAEEERRRQSVWPSDHHD